MAQRVVLTLCLAALAALPGCSGEGGGDGADTATIVGRLTTAAPQAAARATAQVASGSYYVEAVDNTGVTRDVDSEVTDTFALQVPTGHDYVLIVGDDRGAISAMMYAYGDQGGSERADFTVPIGTVHVDLGTLDVEMETRMVRSRGDGDSLTVPAVESGEDTDNDHIPDMFDSDDDNDGEDDDQEIPGVAGMGDASLGAQVYAANGCAGCHGDDGSGTQGYPESIRGESAQEIDSVLRFGEGGDNGDESMPAFLHLVEFAPDLAAFLSQEGPLGTPGDTTSGDGTNNGGGTQPPGNGDGNPTPADLGQSVYDTNCAVCHSLGSHDTVGGPGPNLAGKGSLVPTKFTAGQPGHQSITLAADEITALQGFLNSQ